MIEPKIRVRVDAEIQDLIPPFLENCRAELDGLEEAFRAGGWTEVASIAHRLAGSGSCHGFPTISRLAFALERAARGQDYCALPALLAELRDFLGRVEVVSE